MSLWTISFPDRNVDAVRRRALVVSHRRPVLPRRAVGGLHEQGPGRERRSTSSHSRPPAASMQLFVKGANATPHKVAWSPDGKELFYVPRIFEFEAVSITTTPTFGFGNAVRVPRPFQPGGPSLRTPVRRGPERQVRGACRSRTNGACAPCRTPNPSRAQLVRRAQSARATREAAIADAPCVFGRGTLVPTIEHRSRQGRALVAAAVDWHAAGSHPPL